LNFMYGTSPPRSIVPKRGGGTRASLVGIELKSVGCAPTDFIREIGCYLNLGLLLICPYIFCLSYVSPRLGFSSATYPLRVYFFFLVGFATPI